MNREDGNSLIEVMLVVAILAVLIGLAFPQLAGARDRAADRAAMVLVRAGYVSEQTFYASTSAFTGAPADLDDVDPSLRYVAGSPAAAGEIGVATPAGDASVVCVTSRSATGAVFGLKEITSGPDSGVYYYHRDVSAACDGQVLDGVPRGW